MSISVTYTCDRCGEDGRDETGVEVGDLVPDIPRDWHVDPEDDELHICEWCWDELNPPLSGHPNPARALPMPSGPEWLWGTGGSAVPAYSHELCPCGVVHRAPKEARCE